MSELGSLPAHVKELFERAAINLVPCQKDALYALLHDYADIFSQGPKNLVPCQNDALYALLHDYADIFSQGRKDLGRTDLAEHWIDTGDAPPPT